MSGVEINEVLLLIRHHRAKYLILRLLSGNSSLPNFTNIGYTEMCRPTGFIFRV